MDRPPQEPWREYEERELLCNIIKASNIGPDEVYGLIAQHHVEPSWDNIPLPNGRPLGECRRIFNHFFQRRPFPPQLAAQQYSLGPAAYGGPARSRATYDPQLAVGRPILPKTAPSTPSESGPAFPQSPRTDQPTTRKRGRPPKEEVSRRRAEAEARGEPYPQPRTKRPKRPSQVQATALAPPPITPARTSSLAAPTTSTPARPPPLETGSDSSGTKRRRLQRPPDIETGGPQLSRDPATTSYESPPQTSVTATQPGALAAAGARDPDSRMEGVEETTSTSRAPSYREIVGIRGSS